MAKIVYNDLVNYRKLKASLALLKEQIKECDAMIYDISASKITQEGKSNIKKIDKIGNVLSKAESLKERYISEMDECISQMKKITDALKTVKDSEHRRAVYLHYVVGLPAYLVTDKMNISNKTFYRYCTKVLKDLGLSRC